MTTLAKQESIYQVWTDAGVPDGASVLVQNQSTAGMHIHIYTGTAAPTDEFEGIVVTDWITFKMKAGDKLFHTPSHEPHGQLTKAMIRVDAS
ncbi:hypothetical protein ACJ7RV_002605 [Vibrio parahaemolyticus]